MNDTSVIPRGPYCYACLGPMDAQGLMRVKDVCPYWERRAGDHAYCRFLDYETEYARELLWDQVKACGVNDPYHAQGMSARQGENSRSEVEGEARQPGPATQDAPNLISSPKDYLHDK